MLLITLLSPLLALGLLAVMQRVERWALDPTPGRGGQPPSPRRPEPRGARR